MKSKSKIEKQISTKTNPVLVQTIILAKKNPNWIQVAHILTNSRKKRRDFNLSDVENAQGDLVVVSGKLLSNGEIKTKKKVCAMNFSAKALEKLKNAGCETSLLSEEIERNKEAKGVLILK